MKWKYNGVAPMGDIIDWCRVYLDKGNWLYDWETIYFQDEKAHIAFLLRWS